MWCQTLRFPSVPWLLQSPKRMILSTASAVARPLFRSAQLLILQIPCCRPRQGAFTTANQGNLLRLVASLAPQTQHFNSSSLKTRPSSQILQQGALSDPVIFPGPSIPTTGLQTSTAASLLGSSIGGHTSASTTPDPRNLTVAPNYTITRCISS